MYMVIDYKYGGGRFPVSTSCVTIQNPNLLSSSGTGVIPGLRSWESAYLKELDVDHKAVGGI
jgi:hypothetical protein